MAGPTVTVGMPVYNGERYMRDAIDSILAQTYQDFELLIVDNASTDNTGSIATDFVRRDPRVKHYRFRENYGVAHNWNETFRLSSGSYFKWAAYDDLCAPDFLDRCVRVLDRDSSVVLAYPRTVGIDEAGERVNIPAVVGPGFKPDADYADHQQGILSLVASNDPVTRFGCLLRVMWNAHFLYGVIRSAALAKTALHRAHYAGDHLLLAELSMYGRFWQVPEELFFLRIHQQRTSQAQPLHVQAGDTSKGSSKGGWWKLRHGYQGRMKAYVDVLSRAPLTRAQRFQCYREVMRMSGRWIKSKTLGAGE